MSNKEKNQMFNSQIIDSVNDVILIIDPTNYQIIQANKAALNLLKLDKENIVGKTCYEVTHHRSTPCTPPNDTCPMQEMLKTQNSTVVEHQHYDIENHRMDVEVSVHPIKNKDGKIIQVLHIDKEITERKEQERKEKTKSEELIRIMDGVGDLLFVMDKNRIITKVNKATCDAFKKKPEEIIGKHCFEIVHGTKEVWCNCPGTKTFETKQTITEEVNDPNLGIPLLITTSPILDEIGEITQIIHMTKDISERKEIEIRLKESEEKYRSYTENSPVAFFVVTSEGKYIQVNDAATKLLFYSKNELLKMGIVDILFEKDISSGLKQFASLMETGEARFEIALKRKDGEPVYVILNAIRLSNGRMMAFCENISERKEIEIRLKESEEKYQTTFEKSMDALMLLDETGFFDCNAATLSLFGCKSVEEFTKNHPADLSPITQPDGVPSIEAALNHINKAFKTGMDSFFWIHKKTDGHIFPANVLLTRIHLKNRDVLQATVRDITESKKAEDDKNRLLHDLSERVKELNCIYGISKIFEKSDFELEDSMAQSVNLLSPAMRFPEIACAKIVVNNLEFSTKNFKETPWKLTADIITSGKKVGFVAINYLKDPSAYSEGSFLKEERLLIDIVAERLGKVIERKQAVQHLKDAEEKHRTLLNVANVLVQSVDSKGKYLFVNEEWKKVLQYNDADMEKITITDVVRKDHLQYCKTVFSEVMNGQSIHDVETVFVSKDGREIVVSGNACPVFKDDKFVSTVAFFVDITERKKNEEKLKENSQRIALMNEKLRVVGGLSRHDVRNKLSTITGYAYLLKKKHADQADIVEGLSKMEMAVKESMKIFDFAKMYEQIGVEKLTFIDVEAKINEAATLFSGSLPKIINECHGLTVLADSFLRQMFYNFVDNTRKYGQKTTTIKVHFHQTNQSSLVLFYEDDGVGISEENKLKLFSEGFSTGGSTGFGLFLTKKMIEVYGWTIEENGTLGEGAKFTITIPKLNKDGEENYKIV